MSNIRLSGYAERIPNTKIIDLSTIEFSRSPEEKAAQIKKLGKLGLDTIALDPVSYGAVPSPAKATYIRQEGFGEGREESARGVSFGQLIINSHKRHEQPEFVAVKPFDDPTADVLYHEIAATNYLNHIGEIQNSFLPLGVWKNAEGILSMVSLYEHGVTTADNTFWVDRDQAPEALRPQRVKTAFTDCVWGLGYLHGAGIVHGDAEAKNLAHDSRNIRFVDLESVKLLPRDDSRKISDNEITEQLRMADLDTFISSSLQVEENRPEIVKFLGSDTAAHNLGIFYRKGMKKGLHDSGLIFPTETASESDARFKYLIDTTLQSLS